MACNLLKTGLTRQRECRHLIRPTYKVLSRGLAKQPGRVKAVSRSSDAPVPDATTLFKLTNPELYLDTKKRSTWYLVGAVWIFFGSYTGYLYLQDIENDRERDKANVGPRREDGGY
mmetsp:Transcript_5556/g.6357  ORF Transcript_5556/g.6357 Transcript_5556/m.6357 type:complete len:116 (+) Transcript_5556:64-411(+)